MRTHISAGNPAIFLSPATWLVRDGRAQTINAGAYLVTCFTGHSCLLHFEPGHAAPHARIMVLIDERLVFRGPVDATPLPLALPEDTASWPHHRLEIRLLSLSGIIDRWNDQVGGLIFAGMTIDANATLAAPHMQARSVLFFGDSITEGQWVMAIPPGAPIDNLYHDATLSYAYLQRHLLGVEVGIIGVGRQGFGSLGIGNVPCVTDAYPMLWRGVARNFGGPDLIVINHGTNDGPGNDSGPARILSGIQSMLSGLLAATPATTDIVVMRPFNGAGWAELQAGIAAVRSVRVSSMDTTGFFDPAESADGLHPLGSANLNAIAPKVAAALAPKLGERYLQPKTASGFANA